MSETYYPYRVGGVWVVKRKQRLRSRLGHVTPLAQYLQVWVTTAETWDMLDQAVGRRMNTNWFVSGLVK
jgi:hypothetical protein